MSCVECGTPLRAGTRGRRPRYCSRACQAKAYRARVAAGAVRPEPRAAAPREEPDKTLAEETIVRAAVAVADAEGIGALSMRRVAAELGAGTMSLYRYVPGKEELITLMVEAIVGDMVPPDRSLAGWRARLEATAREDWRLYRAHPWALPYLTNPRVTLLPNMAANVEWALAAFDELNLPPQERFKFILTVSNYTAGAGLLAANDAEADRNSGVDLEGWWLDRLEKLQRSLDPADHPNLAALLHDQEAVNVLDSIFDDGLENVLNGIAVKLGVMDIRPPAHGGHG